MNRPWWLRSVARMLQVHVSRSAFRPRLAVLEDRWCPANFTVNSTGDSSTGSGNAGSLRYCIGQANSTPGADTITFDATVFATRQTITLNGKQLALSDTTGATTITGPAAGVTISGTNAFGVLAVDASVTASLSGLTITKGNTVVTTGSSQHDGGGILNLGTLSLTNCTITDNTASQGGGVFNSGTLTLSNSTVTGNLADVAGGGVFNKGTLTLSNSTISGNSASNNFGGGVYNRGGGTATVTNSTITGNTCGVGGGVYNGGTLALTNCTISANSATRNNSGGGLRNISKVTLTNTIIAAQTVGTDITGNVVVTSENNLIGDGTGALGLTNGTNGNQIGTTAAPINPLLAALGNYGGLTKTMALFPGSPAIDAGTSIGAPLTDQRGVSRSGSVDIGAFEVGNGFVGKELVVDNTSDIDDGNFTAGNLTLREAVDLANVPSGVNTITFDPVVFATPKTITLTNGQLALLDTTGVTTITGPTAGVTISGNNLSGVFSVAAKVTASLSGLTITKGNNPQKGGGVSNLGTLTLTNSTVSGNHGLGGGGVYNGGTLTLMNSTISGNTGANGSNGGGLYNVFMSTMSLTNCTITGNSTPGRGGGVYSAYETTLTLTNCTITGNDADTGGGGVRSGGSAKVTLTNTIVADQTGGGDVSGTVAGTSANNLIGDKTGLSGILNGVNGNQIGTEFNPIDPLLGPLAFNGGPTQTMALLVGSPAINAGTSVGAPPTDQRGFPRIGGVAIGAFESLTQFVVDNTSDVDDGIFTAGNLSLREAISLADAIPVANTITFDSKVFSTPQTITLGGSDLALTDSKGETTIIGPAAGLTISGNNASDVFFVSSGAIASLSGLTITNGLATFAGGAVSNDGTLTMTDCTIAGNIAGFGGGGVFNTGTATLTNCTISGNEAGDAGGGLFNNGTLTLTNCTVTGNAAAETGGGVLNNGTLTLTNTIVASQKVGSDISGSVTLG
ncbi:MAG: right-handed parallel beta-helix repeat-containing protein, partial [Planctomycetes bacterium]|nr:right-handed parallel beta-helix repeat-containing protein [Planctomycetota bacterium]